MTLPFDSYCSASLVSQHRASYVAQVCLNLKFHKLSSPVPVTVAVKTPMPVSPVLQQWKLLAHGLLAKKVFFMLGVPGLAWSVLFGNNNLAATNATQFLMQN